MRSTAINALSLHKQLRRALTSRCAELAPLPVHESPLALVLSAGPHVGWDQHLAGIPSALAVRSQIWKRVEYAAFVLARPIDTRYGRNMGRWSKLIRTPEQFVRDAPGYLRTRIFVQHLRQQAQVSLGLAIQRSPAALTKERELGLTEVQLLRTREFFELKSRKARAATTHELETFFFNLVEAYQPSLFIEAGAKDATTSRRVKKLSEGAKVIAFEANPFTYKRFRKLNAASIDYRNVALSSKLGDVSFNVRKKSDGAPSADGQGSLLKHKNYEHGHLQVTVPSTTLDRVVADAQASSKQTEPNLALWVDVEGAVADLLLGGREAFNTASLVFIEVEKVEVWGSQLLSNDVSSRLYDAGLRAVARDFQSPRQYNVLFVRKELLQRAEFRAAHQRYCERLQSKQPRSAWSRARHGCFDQVLSNIERWLSR